MPSSLGPFRTRRPSHIREIAAVTGDLFGDCLRSDDEHGVATNALGNIVIYAPHRSPERKHDPPNATAP